MKTDPELSHKRWTRKAINSLISGISIVVFTFLDLLDIVLCFAYRLLDEFLEENPIPCYCCQNRGKQGSGNGDEGEEISETLHGRKNIFREMGFLNLRRENGKGRERGGVRPYRWSDCGCKSCISWQDKEKDRLHLVVKEPSQAAREYTTETETQNVICIHGFLSSSSFWTEAIFPQVSEPNFRMFALDLLGFGRSPKPFDSLYRLKDHIHMIEKSVINPFQLDSFHLVGHSMGCVIALNLAAKYPTRVRSITLVAPPYFPSSEAKVSQTTLNKLAERKVWPPLLFGSAVMSWYEHIGRTICFLFCRNHLIWERFMKIFTKERGLNFLVTDMTRHTHHSAWHTMHNVICGGAKLQDTNLEIIKKAGISMKIIHGDRDQVVPIECSYNMKLKVYCAELTIVSGEDHNTVIFGREKDFTRELEEFWLSCGK